MQALLQDIVVGNIFVFLLVFMRFGVALMLMPGIGDNFVTPQVRLLFALALSFMVVPVLAPKLPAMPAASLDLILLLLAEATVGIFIGTVMRILISSLDTAGLIASMQTGFANAMIFNPVTATQGSLMGALYATLGVTLLLVGDMHHYLLATIVESYQLFPAVIKMMPMDDVFEIIARTVSGSFLVGVKMAMPFIVVGTLIQYGVGLINKLMPQLQLYFVAMPLQIAISLILFSATLAATMAFWSASYSDMIRQFTEL